MNRIPSRNLFHRVADGIVCSDPVGDEEAVKCFQSRVVTGQRFLIPNIGRLLSEDQMRAEPTWARLLPYESIVLLSELTEENGTPFLVGVDCMPEGILGFTGDGRSGHLLRVQVGIYVANHKKWVLAADVLCCIDDDKGLGGFQTDPKFKTPYSEPEIKRMLHHSMRSVKELCLLLSLKNVGKTTVEPPLALNKKREKNGKPPIYSYHVLTIDGEETFGRDTDAETDRKIRSHYRRGHIRRLDDGHRVWVRPTFVRGGAVGFVDKDYRVKSFPVQ